MISIYVCDNCGSPDIEIKKWVNLNTNIPTSDAQIELDTCFCNNCDEETNYKLLIDIKDKERKRLFKELYSTFIEVFSEMKELAKEVYNLI